MTERFKIGDHIRLSDKFRQSYRTVVVVKVIDDGDYFVRYSGDHDGGWYVSHDEYVKATYPRYGVPVFKTGAQHANIVADVRRALSSRTRNARKPFEPKPFGIGDWVTVRYDGEMCIGQIWADNVAVLVTEAGNVAVQFYKGKGYLKGCHVAHGSPMERAANPYEQLALAS